MPKLRIGWVGFHEEGVLALQALIARGCLVGAITLEDAAAERRSAVADIAAICESASVPTTRVRHINDSSSIQAMRAWDADVVFVIGWSQILSEDALNQARIGTIGAHASLLPRLRGSAPVNWAIIRGESSSGNSLIWLGADVDNGDLVDQTAFPITRYDTCASLYGKVALSNKEMIESALDQFEKGEFPRRPQASLDEPLLPRRRPEDGLLDWTSDAAAVSRYVRALTRPYPGAFSFLGDGSYKVWSVVELSGIQSVGTPGEILGAMRSPGEAACGLLVACGNGLVGVTEIESAEGEILSGPELADKPWAGLLFTSA